MEELRSVKERMVAEDSELRPNIQKLETELQHAKDALIGVCVCVCVEVRALWPLRCQFCLIMKLAGLKSLCLSK